MDFRDTDEDAAFRQQVREFLSREFHRDETGALEGASAAQAAAREGPAGLERYQQWMKKLATRGWIAPAWPVEYGGAGMSIMQQFVFNEELAKARAPRPGGIGVGVAGA